MGTPTPGWVPDPTKTTLDRLGCRLFGRSGPVWRRMCAAANGVPVDRLALWEPPYIPEGVPRPPADTAKTYTELVDTDRRGDAVEFFMSKVVSLPDEFVAQARSSPFWGAQEALAHTLAYDATIMADYTLPAERAAKVFVRKEF